MSEVQVELNLQYGESLDAKVAQIIAGPNIMAREQEGCREVLRQLKTLRDHSRPNIYVVQLSYERIEED
jgi:hypothetical protein